MTKKKVLIWQPIDTSGCCVWFESWMQTVPIETSVRTFICFVLTCCKQMENAFSLLLRVFHCSWLEPDEHFSDRTYKRNRMEKPNPKHYRVSQSSKVQAQALCDARSTCERNTPTSENNETKRSQHWQRVKRKREKWNSLYLPTNEWES